MNNEARNKVLVGLSVALNVVALIIFVLCIVGEHDSTMVAIGLGLVCAGNLINTARMQQQKKEENK